ncbi:MAG: AHH domain-containing protein [Sandaracinaceae bacterium]|nr:AHH domain-containing protein [Sandaracinaceae bacterium]
MYLRLVPVFDVLVILGLQESSTHPQVVRDFRPRSPGPMIGKRNYYNRWRYYGDGGYRSRDPLGMDGGPRPLGYVLDPTNSLDPLGLTARQLGAAMAAEGRPLVAGQTPHHIVQESGGGRFAQMSRDLLARHGIDVNGGANGAALWGTGNSQVAQPTHPGRTSARAAGTYHAGTHIHTHGGVDDAQRMIFRALQAAERRGQDVEALLREIGARQEAGTWRESFRSAGGRCS